MDQARYIIVIITHDHRAKLRRIAFFYRTIAEQEITPSPMNVLAPAGRLRGNRLAGKRRIGAGAGLEWFNIAIAAEDRARPVTLSMEADHVTDRIVAVCRVNESAVGIAGKILGAPRGIGISRADQDFGAAQAV